MTVILINQNVTGLRVELRWDGTNKTETFKMEPGGFGGFDLDAYGAIPNGSKCSVYAWKEGTDLVFQPERTFHYIKGRGNRGSYTFVNELFTKPVTRYNRQAA